MLQYTTYVNEKCSEEECSQIKKFMNLEFCKRKQRLNYYFNLIGLNIII